MPSKSAKQHRLINVAAHDKRFARKAGAPQAVAKEYVAADKKAGRYELKGLHK